MVEEARSFAEKAHEGQSFERETEAPSVCCTSAGGGERYCVNDDG